MKRQLLSIGVITMLLSSCSQDIDIQDIDCQSKEYYGTTRSIDEVKAIAASFTGVTRSGCCDFEVEVITSKSLGIVATRSTSMPGNDTLLYFVSGVENPLLISANKGCEPILAILDNRNCSLQDALNDPNEGNSIACIRI